MGKLIGIDLGTTNSVVAVMEGGTRTAIELTLGDAREALKGEDIERIRRAQETLTSTSKTLTEAAYREARSGSTGPQSSGAPKDDVVDAEFKNVDDRKP